MGARNTIRIIRRGYKTKQRIDKNNMNLYINCVYEYLWGVMNTQNFIY